jgi:hypothetical protein
MSNKSWISRGVAALVWVCALSALAPAESQPQYLLTNDDASFTNRVTFYTVEANGLLKLKEEVTTAGAGIGGGFFGTNRLALLNTESDECVYASDAFAGDIAGINVSTLQAVGSTSGSKSDSGAANGIGLVISSKYLYAGFTTSNTIGTFKIEPGCSLTFVSDVPAAGLNGGMIDGMAIHGNMLVVTYGDGSIESFDISKGVPTSNGDEQNSTAFLQSAEGATYPTSVEITKDGHFAIFGDTSDSTVVEVSKITSGKLTKTVVYSQKAPMSSSNILLSPDETLLYVSNTQGDAISALFFDSHTGKLSPGCTSGKLKGYSTDWSYLASLALETNTGTGGVIYVAEFGSPSSIGMIQLSSTGGKCKLKELSGSPVSDPNSPGLLSIGSFPPRSF